MRYHQLIVFSAIVTAGLILGSLVLTPAMAASVPLMTKDELKAVLDEADVVVLDVRGGKDWKSSEFKIKNAERVDPKKFDTWRSAYGKDKKLVLYCA